MLYPLTRLEGDEEVAYTVELDYQIGENLEPWMAELEPDSAITIIGAWVDGKVFALTEKEIADAEDWIAGRL